MQVHSATKNEIIVKLNDNRGEVTVTVTYKTTSWSMCKQTGTFTPVMDWVITKIIARGRETDWLQSHHMNNVYRLVKCVQYIKTQAA